MQQKKIGGTCGKKFESPWSIEQMRARDLTELWNVMELLEGGRTCSISSALLTRESQTDCMTRASKKSIVFTATAPSTLHHLTASFLSH